MKKILLIILLLIPFYVYAEDSCNQDDIQIESITLDSTQGNIEQTIEPTNDNNSINLGLKANVIDDNITYKVVIKNTSDKDYTFDQNSLSTDYLNYDITYEDGSDIVKAGESKIIYLKVHYATKPAENTLSNGVVTIQPKVTFNLQKEEEVKTIVEEIVNAITNPNTNDKILLYLGLLILSLVLTIIILRKYKKAKMTTMLIITFLITTQIVKAVCTCQLNINTELEIDAKEATFLTGKEVNIKMKELTGDDPTSWSYGGHWAPNVSITAILKSETEPIEANKQEANIVSTDDSPYPIYMWFDNGTIYWWSEDDTPAVNEDTSYMFASMEKIENISGISQFDVSKANDLTYLFGFDELISSIDSLKNWNVSNVTSLYGVFEYVLALTSIEPISNWDTSNVTNMADLFCETGITTLEPISNWDISKVTDMSYMFTSTPITTLEPIRNWDISNVKSLERMFSNTILTSIEPIRNWDVSNAESIGGMFAFNKVLTSIEPMTNWDISNVKDLSSMFCDMDSLTSLKPVANWNTSNVEDMSYLICSNGKITTVEDLANWDTSKVTTMKSMFHSNLTINDLSPISQWDTSSLTDMSFMFYGMKNIEVIDISGWDTRKVNDFSLMFYNDKNLRHIYVGENWDTSANTSTITDIFPDTSYLPNFNNSSSNRKNISYAHTGPGGYLELKPED